MPKPSFPSSKDPDSLDRRLQFYGDKFVFDSVSGMFYRINPSACFMLKSLAAGTPVADLPARLQARYELDSATASRDVQLFLNSLTALEPLGRLFDPARGAP